MLGWQLTGDDANGQKGIDVAKASGAELFAGAASIDAVLRDRCRSGLVSRKGRKAASAIVHEAQSLGPLRSPFATQGRSYTGEQVLTAQPLKWLGATPLQRWKACLKLAVSLNPKVSAI